MQPSFFSLFLSFTLHAYSDITHLKKMKLRTKPDYLILYCLIDMTQEGTLDKVGKPQIMVNEIINNKWYNCICLS